MNPIANNRTEVQVGRLVIGFVVFLGISGSAWHSTLGQKSGPSSLSWIPAGTKVSEKSVEGWSKVVLVATPKVTSGDINNVSELVQNYANMFTTVMAAKTQIENNQFTLAHIGIGLAVSRGQKNLEVVSSRGSTPHRLGMIAAQVLSKGEEALDKIVVTARTPTAIAFDSPAVVQRGNKHQLTTVRHLVWTNPQTGSLHSAVWLIQEAPKRTVIDGQISLLPENFRESRKLHVDKSEFFFGLPSEKAFALESLPSGTTIRVDSQLAKLASAKTINTAALVSAITETSEHSTHSSRTN